MNGQGSDPMATLAEESAPTTAESMGISDVQEWLDGVQKTILDWDSGGPFEWDSETAEASTFLRTVDEVRELTENLEPALLRSTDPRARRILNQARVILELAMEKLEEEFTRILLRSRQSLDLGRLSFQSTEDDHGDRDDVSFSSMNGESFERRFPGGSTRSSNHVLFDPVQPAAISDLKSIADLMFKSGYGGECLQAYISARKGVLQDCFSLLRVENLSTEELMAMESKALGSMIKRWTQAMKTFCQVYLPSERNLCDGIFGPAGAACFSNTTKRSFFQLLSFGEAIAISTPQLEKVFSLLDMFECLADLMPGLRDLFAAEEEDAADSVLVECREVLSRLGEAVIASFLKLKDCASRFSSHSQFPGGGPFHTTKYVMNFIVALASYRETLCSLLQRDERDQEEEARADASSALRRDLLSVVSLLEETISRKSMLYTDEALRHVFLMNNIQYMVKKVKGSELEDLFGEEWIRARNVQIHLHARDYQRICWSPVLSLLRVDPIPNQRVVSPRVRGELKERFKSFNLAFEEIYRTQTAWHIPDERLRDDVVIAISINVLRAYGNFKDTHEPYLAGVRHRSKYVKFTVDDLEHYVLDLFLGSAKVLQYPLRRAAP